MKARSAAEVEHQPEQGGKGKKSKAPEISALQPRTGPGSACMRCCGSLW